jgi:transposase
MSMLAEPVDAVIGVDTHTDTHTACLIDRTGRDLAAVTVDATAGGYAELLDWASRHVPGPRVLWAVEGCRSHGAGLCRALLAAGQQVVEAGRPRRSSRRPGGKSDPADARLAAGTALAAAHHAHPRSDGDREALRILLVAREHANATRTAAVNVFKSLLLTGPDQLRDPLVRQSTARQTAVCARLRVHPRQSTTEQVRRRTLRDLAQQIRLLDKEIRVNTRQLRDLVHDVMPVLLAEPGVGPVCAAYLLIAWSHPRPMSLRGRVRRAGWRQPDRSVLRTDQAPPTQPLRRPQTQPRPSHHRELAHPARPRTHPPLPRPAPRRAEDRPGDPPLPQALHRATSLPGHGGTPAR